jgi:hypothetical protein
LVDPKTHLIYNSSYSDKQGAEMNTVEYKVGDDVSHGIGGDRYYDGKITRITKRFIFTDSGRQYTRKVDREGRVYYTQTGCKYCYLMAGKHEYMDPHF